MTSEARAEQTKAAALLLRLSQAPYAEKASLLDAALRAERAEGEQAGRVAALRDAAEAMDAEVHWIESDNDAYDWLIARATALEG